MVAATVQEVSGGRFLLGLGAGSEQFLGWAGIARARPLATTRTALVSLRALLGHEDVDRACCRTGSAPDSVLRFPLSRPVPVYVGAMGPKMLEMAGRHADGVLPLLYPPERYASVRQQVMAGRGGRSRRDVDLPPASGCRSPTTRRRPGRRWPRSWPTTARPSPRRCSRRRAAAAGLRPGRRGWPTADAAAAAAHRRPHAGPGRGRGRRGRAGPLPGARRLGASHLSFGPPLGPDPVAAIRLLGDQVLPALNCGARADRALATGHGAVRPAGHRRFDRRAARSAGWPWATTSS